MPIVGGALTSVDPAILHAQSEAAGAALLLMDAWPLPDGAAKRDLLERAGTALACAQHNLALALRQEDVRPAGVVAEERGHDET